MAGLQDEQSEERSRLRLGPVVAVLTVMVLVLLCVLGLLGARVIFGNEDDPSAGGEETTSSAPATESTKPLMREDLKVVVGEGGSSTAQNDPTVPTGYEPTCKGAVEAATNYLVGMDYTKTTSGDLRPDDYIALVQELTTGDYQASAVESNQEMLDNLEGTESPRGSIEPDWGGFTLTSCSEGESASVAIVSAADYAGTGEFYYGASTTELTWADGDWKISGSGSAETPVTLPEDPVTAPDEEVLTLVGTHTQWENYEDAS